MIRHLPSGFPEFDEWFTIPSPGYTVFWLMPETCDDPKNLVSRWIASSVQKSKAFVVHCTRSNVDGFLSLLQRSDPGCASTILGLGSRMHFLDSYSARLEMFGGPLRDYQGLDIRYVTDTCRIRGAGTLSDVMRELREECHLEDFVGIENSLTDLAMDMGEAQHAKLFSELVSRMRSRRGTMIGMADWYSHGELYKASIIHLADASILWGITSGSNKVKYLLPIKRSEAAPASSYEPQPYSVGPSRFEILPAKPGPARNVQSPEACYL